MADFPKFVMFKSLRRVSFDFAKRLVTFRVKGYVIVYCITIKRYKPGTDRLTEFRLGANYPGA